MKSGHGRHQSGFIQVAKKELILPQLKNNQISAQKLESEENVYQLRNFSNMDPNLAKKFEANRGRSQKLTDSRFSNSHSHAQLPSLRNQRENKKLVKEFGLKQNKHALNNSMEPRQMPQSTNRNDSIHSLDQSNAELFNSKFTTKRQMQNQSQPAMARGEHPINVAPHQSDLNDPFQILRHHNDCKNENIERLKKVEKLEDLVKFKMSTIADKLKKEQDVSGGRQLDSLLGEDSVGQHHSTLETSKQVHSQPFVYQESSQAISVLSKMCDPLLANQVLQTKQYPKLMLSNKAKIPLKSQAINQTSIDKYEIPDELKQLPKNFNPYIPLKDVMPKPGEAKEKKKMGGYEQFDISHSPPRFELDLKNQAPQEEAQVIDPQVMLKQYFNKMDSHKTEKQKRYGKEISNHLSSKAHNKSLYSENYLVSKYEKKKHNGELQKLEEQIYKREQRERLMMKSPGEFEEADDDLYDDSKLNTAKFQMDPDFGNVIHSQSQKTEDTGTQQDEGVVENNATFYEGFQEEDMGQQNPDTFIETLHSQQQFANEKLQESQGNLMGVSIFDQLVDQNVPDLATLKTTSVQHNLKISQIKNLQSYKNYSQNKAGIHEYIPLSKQQIEIAQTFQKGKDRDARKQRSPRISRTEMNNSPKTPKRRKVPADQDDMLQYKMQDLKVIQKQKFKHMPNKEPAPKEEFFPKKSNTKMGAGLQPVVGSSVKIEEVKNSSRTNTGADNRISRLTSAEEPAEKAPSPKVQEKLIIAPVKQIESKVAYVKKEMLINPYQNNQLTAQQTQKISISASPREEIQTAEIGPNHPLYNGSETRQIDQGQQMSRVFDQSFEGTEQSINSPGRYQKQLSQPVELRAVDEQQTLEEQTNQLVDNDNKHVINLSAETNLQSQNADKETINLHQSELGDIKKQSQNKFNIVSNRGSIQQENIMAIPKMRNQAMTVQTTESQLNRVSQHNIQLGFDGPPEQQDAPYERNSTIGIEDSTLEEKVLPKNSSTESLTRVINQTSLDLDNKSQPRITSSLKGNKLSNQAFPQTHNTSINVSSRIHIVEQTVPEEVHRHSTENLKVGADVFEDLERMKLDGIINMHLVKRAQWVPQRYTKNPRHYARSSPRNIQAVRESSYDESMQYISLNPQIIALLTSSDINQANVFPINQMSQSRPNIQVINQQSEQKKTFMDLGHVDDRKDTTGRMGAVTEALGSLHEQSLTQVIEDSPESQKRNTNTLLRNTNTMQQDTVHDVPAEAGATADSILQSQDDSLNQTGRQYFDRGPDANAINTVGNSSLQEIVEVRTNATPPVNQDLSEGYDNFQDLDVQQVFDPFQKVLITKQNQIDNQILTSFRTLTKENNIISNTLKVLHKRFQPIKSNNKNRKLKALYEIKHYDDVKQEITIQNVHDGGDVNKIPIENLEAQGHESGFMNLTGHSFRLPLGEPGDITQDSFASTHAGLNLNLIRDKELNPAEDTLRSRSASDQGKRSHRNMLQVKRVPALEAQQVNVPTTTAKQTQVEKLQKAPMAIYDVTAGQAMEEEGYGYWRSKYVLDPYFPTKKKEGKQLLNQHSSEHQLLTERTLMKNNSDSHDIGVKGMQKGGTLEKGTKHPTGVTASRQYLLVFSDGKPVNTGTISSIQQVPTSQNQTPLQKVKRKSIPIPQKKETAGLTSDGGIVSSRGDLQLAVNSLRVSQENEQKDETQRIPEIMLMKIPAENAYEDEEETKNMTKSSYRRQIQGNTLKKFNSSQTSNIVTPAQISKEGPIRKSKDTEKANDSQIFENDSSIGVRSNKTSTTFKGNPITANKTIDVNGGDKKTSKMMIKEVDLAKVQNGRKKTINLQNKDDVTVLGQTSKGDTSQHDLVLQNQTGTVMGEKISVTNPNTITGNSYYQFDLLKSASNRQQHQNPISVLVQQQTAKQQSTKNQNKPTFPGGFKNSDIQHHYREVIMKQGDSKDTSMQASRRVTSQNSTERVADATKKQLEMKTQIKNLIDSTFKNDLKYTRKQVAREDLVLASDAIFDLGKLQNQKDVVNTILNGGPTENPDDQVDSKVVLRGQAMKKQI